MTTGHAHRPNRGDSPAATDHQSHGGEPPTADECAITVDVAAGPSEIVDEIVDRLGSLTRP